jgi:DNA-binding XRE family transcriptional regulator
VAKKQGQDKRAKGRKGAKPEETPVMTPAAFKHWRKSLRLSQKEAAQALGLKRRALQYYEKGERDGDPVAIPKVVRLACYALAQGCDDYVGPMTGARAPLPAGAAVAPSDKAETPKGGETA